jgi:hypothetical protein
MQVNIYLFLRSMYNMYLVLVFIVYKPSPKGRLYILLSEECEKLLR